MDKYFPNNIDDNIRQLHSLKEIDVASLVEKQKVDVKHLQLKTSQLFENTEVRKREALFQTDFRNTLTNIPVQSFPRKINEHLLRLHFIKFFEKKPLRQHSEKDLKFQEILKIPSTENEQIQITNVVEMKYRMTIFFEQLTPKVNIIIAWLLLFVGSLEYQLNPNLFTQDSKSMSSKVLTYYNYKNEDYYEAQSKLEQLLTKYFEKVLKTLIYKFNFEFNPKCPLLTLLFQYTHKYNFLHQKLIDIVHQDIDQ